MLPRREFLSSLAASLFATGGLLTAGSSGAVVVPRREGIAGFSGDYLPPDLKWPSVVIETVPHNDAYRPPVITHICAQEQGSLVAVVGDDHIVSLFDRDGLTFVEHLRRHRDWVRCCQFSPDGQLLATAGNDRMLYLWRVGQWDNPILMKRNQQAIFNLAFSPGGNQIALVGFGNNLMVFDAESGRLITELSTPSADTHAVAYSLDGKLLAAGGRCGTVRIWDAVDQYQNLAEFSAHRQRIRSLQFTPDQRIISASDDQFVRITNPFQTDAQQALPRMSAKLFATALLDDDLLATAGSDNAIRIWQISNQQLLGMLRGHTGTVTTLNYTRKQLISGSYDTRIRIWTPDRPTGLIERTTELNPDRNFGIK
jgi:WD40 repeat protein